MQIHSPAQIEQIMRQYRLQFHKGLGQNFLFDANLLEKIADCANVTKEDVVLEIGPGLGVLTTRLASRAKKVIAVEIDKHIIPALSDLTSSFSNIEIVQGDIMKTDVKSLLQGEKQVKVVANLPYYITTPVVMKLLEEKAGFSSITIMVQKEVALRMQAKPGTKDYGAFTLAVQYYADPHIAFTVPASAFIPPPKVDSAVLTLTVLPSPPVWVDDEKRLFQVIKAAFGQRRKTLVNALSAGFPEMTKESIRNSILSCGFSETCRGETLSLADFAKITNCF